MADKKENIKVLKDDQLEKVNGGKENAIQENLKGNTVEFHGEFEDQAK